MKKIFTVCLFSLLVSSAFAQDISTSAEKRINLLTRVMATELGLNESEYVSLKALNRERILKSDEITDLYGHDEILQNKKLLELETSFDKKIKTMLNPSQLATYAAYKQGPYSELALSEKPKLPANKK